MLKKVKKYSLFLILTVFFSVINVYNIRAVGLGDAFGSGSGNAQAGGAGEFGSLTSPHPSYNGSKNTLNNPGVRITAVDKNGKKINNNYVDVLTFEFDMEGYKNGLTMTYEDPSEHDTTGFGYFTFANGGTAFDKKPISYNISTEKETKNYIYVDKDDLQRNGSCWGFQSCGDGQTLTEDINELLKSDSDLYHKILTKLNLKNPDTTNTFLVVEPIIIMFYNICPTDYENWSVGTCHVIYYGTSTWYKSTGIYPKLSNGKDWPNFGQNYDFFTITKSELKQAGMNENNAFTNLVNAHYYSIKSNTEIGGINIMNLVPDPTQATLSKWKVNSVNPKNTNCTNKQTMVWKTKSKKNGTTTSIGEYNLRYGKKVYEDTNAKCALYCHEKLVAYLPSLTNGENKPILDGNQFTWISANSSKFKIKLTLTCRYLPYSEKMTVNEANADAYKNCMGKNITIENNKIFNSYDIKINNVGHIYYNYTTANGTEELLVNLIAKDATIENGGKIIQKLTGL